MTSYAAKRRRLRLALEFDADFTDIFEIRGFRRDDRGPVRAELATGSRVA